jgi:hypothetical protein
MKDIVRVIAEKEFAYRRVKAEIEALRLAVELLAEPGDGVAMAANAGTVPVHVNTPLEPPRPAAPPQPRPAPPPAAIPAMADVISFRGTTGAVATSASAPPTKTVFALALDGALVCDACGHRNPEYVMDCEQCDIPLRLRT